MLDDRLDIAEEIGLRLVKLPDSKSAFSLNFDVHWAVVVIVNARDSDDCADHIRIGEPSRGSAPNENHPKGALELQARSNHLAITLLEDMKLQRGVRKDYGVQREQRQFLERVRHPYQIVRRFAFPDIDKGALSY